MVTPSKALSFKGVLIESMSTPDLQKLAARAEKYMTGKRATGKPPALEYVELQAGVAALLEKRRGTLSKAFETFAARRRDAQSHGYTVPSIAGDMAQDDVMTACAILAQAVSVVTPLPSEDMDAPAMVKLQADAQADILRVIAELNQAYNHSYPVTG